MTRYEQIASGFSPDKANLLAILHALHDSSGSNSVSEADIEWAAAYLNLTKAWVYGVVTYYSLFSEKERAPSVVRVCCSLVCRMKGSAELLENLNRELDSEIFKVEKCECLGYCNEAPVVYTHGKMVSAGSGSIIAKIRSGQFPDNGLLYPPHPAEVRRLLHPANSAVNRQAVDVYPVCQKALSLDQDVLIEMIVSSGLRGRGGAGFPTGTKMKYTLQAARKRGVSPVLICNADEGEPGTFKDRIIMRFFPHLLIEGMLISACATGAETAYIYIRDEYREERKCLEEALVLTNQAGLTGSGSGKINVIIRPGAGSYLCGEELTLIGSLQGQRGHPGIKPPYPAEKGLDGLPTLINNVETLANIPLIVGNGPGEFRKTGTTESPGTKIFTLCGDVEKPGYYEFPMGTSLRTLIYDAGGGMAGGVQMKAALLGGAAGTFVDRSFLDVPMAFETLAAVNATLGSGAVIVLSENRSIPEMLLNILGFFAHESCGKCVPCRVGTNGLLQSLTTLIHQERVEESLLTALESEASLMSATSLCPLGQSPLLPIRSAFRFFGNEFLKP